MFTRIFQILTSIAILFLMTACATFDRRGLPEHTFDVQRVAIEMPSTEIELNMPAVQLVDIRPPPVDPIQLALAQYTEREIHCMTTNMFYEARGEGVAGLAAVGYVVLNRVADGRFRDNICDVVYQRSRGVCQFSWVCSRGFGDPSQRKGYAEVREVALMVLAGVADNPVGKSIFFRHRSLRGLFARSQRYIRSVGNHSFFVSI